LPKDSDEERRVLGGRCSVRSIKVRLPLYAVGLATGGAFSTLFTNGALPYLLGAALIGILVGSAGAYRFILLFPAAMLYTLCVVYGRLPLSLKGWQRLFEEIGQDFYEAAQIMYASAIPYSVHSGLLILLIPIAVLVVSFATSSTLYEESPVVSVSILGLTIGILSTVSVETGTGPFFGLFLVCGTALLLFTGDGVRRGERLRPSAVLGGALVLFFVLALPQTPFAEAAIQPALVDWTRIGTSDASRLAVKADVGDYLTTGRSAQLMRIRSPEPLLWRGGTLDHFDGVHWSSTVKPDEHDGEEISADVPTRDVTQKVDVLEAETSLLFGGYKISAVSIPSAGGRSDGSWISARPLAEGSFYQVHSRIPQPTATQLEVAGTAYPEPVREKFLQLPEDRPEVLGQTAQKIQADYAPETPYQAARAIERYLLHDGGFTYNLDVDYDRADTAIEEFLGEGREGFCTQFATSMALLARELGFPSRVVYGATTGRKVGPDEYLVTGNNVHTWVEVYFPGVGWYPFDPTPGFSIPSAMEANAPRPEVPILQNNSPPENPTALRASQPPQPVPNSRNTPTNKGSQGSIEEDSSWASYGLPPILLLLALCVAVVPLTKRLLVARGRPEDLYQDLMGRLRDVLLLNGAVAAIADSPALTPTERLLLLAGAVGAEAEPFRGFARTYSESLYAPNPRASVARAYHVALREYKELPRWKRVLGSLNPGSLFLRMRRSLRTSLIGARKALSGGKKS
jgi:transglutaminase-like putative cysteine protease